jgi:FtsZ-binding cell division protein ZapB
MELKPMELIDRLNEQISAIAVDLSRAQTRAERLEKELEAAQNDAEFWREIARHLIMESKEAKAK